MDQNKARVQNGPHFRAQARKEAPFQREGNQGHRAPGRPPKWRRYHVQPLQRVRQLRNPDRVRGLKAAQAQVLPCYPRGQLHVLPGLLRLPDAQLQHAAALVELQDDEKVHGRDKQAPLRRKPRSRLPGAEHVVELP